MSTMIVALKKDGYAHLKRWVRGTYIFTKSDYKGRLEVWMKRKDKPAPFVLPFNLDYMKEKGFISGKGTPTCANCQTAKEILKEMRKNRTGKATAKALAEHLSSEHCACGLL